MSNVASVTAATRQRLAHVVCRDCTFEKLTAPGDGAVEAGGHRAETGHETEWEVLKR